MKKLLTRYEFWLTSLSGVGLIAAFWQTAEKIHYLNNPGVPLRCNLNPIFDCGAVLDNGLSSVLGVSNSLIGMSVFAVLFAAGLFMLMGSKLSKPANWVVVALVTLMFLFPLWFFGVSLYIIGKICLFCIAIWGATFPLFVLTMRHYDQLIFGKSTFLMPLRDYVKQHPVFCVIIMYIIAIGLYLFRFRDYYFG